MNVLSREKQIEVIAALCEGVGVRTASRLTGVNRGTVANLALRVGMGCMELHDRIMVGVRTERLELDELWSFVGKKQKNVCPATVISRIENQPRRSSAESKTNPASKMPQLRGLRNRSVRRRFR